jgi:hypothetical protein
MTNFFRKLYHKTNAKDILLDKWRKDFIKKYNRDPTKKEKQKGELAIDITLSVFNKYQGIGKAKIIFKQDEIKKEVSEILIKNGIDPNEF